MKFIAYENMFKLDCLRVMNRKGKKLERWTIGHYSNVILRIL